MSDGVPLNNEQCVHTTVSDATQLNDTPQLSDTAQMSDVVTRFMRYVQVSSQSDPKNEAEVPSTASQHDMARLLEAELIELGCQDVTRDKHAYVTATLLASAGFEHLPALCLCAHIDSAPDAPGEGVKPHIVHYTGGDLVAGVVDGQAIATSPSMVSDLDVFVDQDIICSDGTTLLAADDKAGVAEIMSLLHRLVNYPSAQHPTLKIAFVPDEEIGHGASLLDIETLGAKWGYTVDGGPIGEFSYECFSASEAHVHITGVMIHPGEAKDVMVNAITVAREFDALLPAHARPEHTEARDGFFHPIEIQGSASELDLSYIVRDFDAKAFALKEQQLQDAANFLNKRYGEGTVSVSIKEQYRNMAEIVQQAPELIEHVLQAHQDLGLEAKIVPVRGGTDGAQLSFRGLPCPNIATGAYNMHSVREFIPVKNLEITVDILERIVARFAAM